MSDERLSPVQIAFGVIVAMMWVASFFIPGLDSSARIGVQAAMMLILGRIFGIGLTRRNGDAK